jgi:DNA-binding SARP family transcriptional activator
MARLEIALLGAPQVQLDGVPLDTDRRKAIALLAYLAVTAKAHTREQLAALLWPDYERDSALAYLRRTLWELNNALGKEWLQVERDSIALKQSTDLRLDTHVFLTLTRSPSGSKAALAQALELYRGDFLAGFFVVDTAPFEDWQRQQSEYFQRELGRACERLVETMLESGDFESAIPYAQRWLGLDPLNESAQRAMMCLYAGLGDRAALLRQYESCIQLLKTELGVPPQRETTELYQRLIQTSRKEFAPQEIAQPGYPSEAAIQQTGAAQALPGAPAVQISAGQLPALPTPFIGRRPELEQLKALLLDPAQRLVTLTGPGGTGKTRLSIQAAAEIARHFPDGVWFTPLAALQSAEGLVPAVAKALDFSFYKEEERPRQQLLEYLWEKELLLILDNFEHLVGNGAVQLVSDILQTARRVKLLVTSRVRLNIQGEQLYQVKGMRTPDPAAVARWEHPDEELQFFSGLNLFVEREFSPRSTWIRRLWCMLRKSAAWWRGCRWASSWQPPGWSCSRRQKSPLKFAAAWTFWRASRQTCPIASAAYAPYSSHPGSCWMKMKNRFSCTCVSSRAVFLARQPRRSAALRCARCSGWRINPGWDRPARGATPCTRCCASSATSACGQAR